MATARQLLASQVRNLLLQRNRRQTELAHGIGKSQPQVSQLLSGKRGISIDVLDDLGRFFAVPVSDLFLDVTKSASGALSLTAEEQAVVKGFRAADHRTKQAVRVLLTVVVEGQEDAETAQNLLGRLADIAHALEGIPIPDEARHRLVSGTRTGK